MKRALLLGLCVICGLSLIFLCSMSQTSGSPGFGDTPRSPISIDGDSQFDVAHGVNGGGDGSAGSPWIIENWVIDASGATGITIQNTTAYFIVRNCLVENGGSTYNGIYLNNVINGIIENNTCSNNYEGIYLSSSSYNNLTNNTCDSNEYGIYLESSSDSNIFYNHLLNNTSSNAYDDGTNYWDDGSEGNWWSDWQPFDHLDTDGNGIVDEPRPIDGGGNQDTYPLVLYPCRHYPILISSDGEFTSDYGVNGGGDGTAGSPYIIENWVIDASGANGIDIQNTTAYFIVRNCLVENGSEEGYYGIYLTGVVNGRIENSVLDNNYYGIYLSSSSYDNLTANTCENNSQYGIRLSSSSYDNLTANTCENNSYNFDVTGTSVSHFDHNIDNSNLVNGRSIYYLKDNSNLVIGSSLNIGYLGLVRCDNIRVENLVLENNRYGILLVSTENSRIENCVLSNNSYGIYLYSSSYDNLTGNTCGNNSYGIYLYSSSYINLTANTCSNNSQYGIYLYSSCNYDNLTGNTCSNNSQYGIYLYSSCNYDNLTGNTCENNFYYGIYLRSSSYDNLTGNTCSNNSYGIYLYSSCNYDNLTGNTCSNNGDYGIRLSSSSNNNLTNNTCENNSQHGIYLYSSSYINLTANTCSNNSQYGIYPYSSSYDNLTNNTCESNDYGIYLYSSCNYDNLTGNTCSNNSSYGIYLRSSSYDNLTGNTCENNRYNFNVTGTSIAHFDHNIDNSNLVNSRSIYYLKDSSDLVIGSSLNIGYVGLVRCDNIRVENLVLENNGQGILLVSTENSRIENCVLSNNSQYGIYLNSSCNYDNLTNNTCENNGDYGIYLYSSSYDNLTGNTCENNRYNFNVTGTSIAHFDHNIDNSNLVNSRSIYYLKDSSDLVIGSSLNIGYVGLVRCDNIRVENLVLENNGQGILLVSTENSRIENCVLSNNSQYGIYLGSSCNYDNLTNNTCENNGDYGIYLYSSDNYNNLTNNTCSNNTYGIYLGSSCNYDNLTNNTCSNNTYGIYLGSSCNYDNLTNNTSSNNGDYGIYLGSSCNYDNLTNNTCSNNAYGIYLGSSCNYDNLTNNTSSNNSQYGIYLGSSCNYDNLTGNTCENNFYYGIYLYSSSYINLTGNTCLNNDDYGIYLNSSCNYNNLTNNTSSNNSQFGIYLNSSCNYNNLTGNTCENNDWRGIFLNSSCNYNNLTGNTCETDYYGIYLQSSCNYDNLTGNTCSNNFQGIYLQSSSYDNLTGNTCSNNYAGINLTDSSYDNLTGNVISNNIYDIYDTETTNTYSSNQFNNNMTSTMLTFTETTRTENVGDNVSFSVSAFNPNGTNLSGCIVTTSPTESSLSYSGSSTVTGSFIPTKSGIYSLNFTVTGENSNTTTRRMLFFVGNTASTTTTYYFRGIRPTHGQPCGDDGKSLLLTAPTSTEIWTCSQWVQNSPDEIPNYPLANLSAIDTYTWYKTRVSEAYIGAQRYDIYGAGVDSISFVPAVTDYTWTDNISFTNLSWAMDYHQSWYWLSLKLFGIYPYWTTFPSGYENQPAYANFTYSYTTTPAIKSISNSDIVVLSATAPPDDNDNATIVLDGTGSTNIVLDNYHRPFIYYTTTINSDNTATIAANGLTGTTTINSVAMDITPSSGYIDVSIDNWNTSGTYYKKWTETGSSSGITASHTIGNLKANTSYMVKVDGTWFDTYQSDSSGQITFTYNRGYSTKTFEAEENTPNPPDTLRVGGQVSPQLLKTFTPEFSFRYTDNDNANGSMVQIQVGTSAGDNSMWDNQRVENVENGATISITYAGTALQRGVQYFWRVRVQDNENAWSDWSDNENLKLSPASTVTVGDSTIELNFVEAGDTLVIPTSDFTIMLTIKTRSENLLIYYARIEGTPQIPAEGVAPFYWDISTTNPDAIADVTLTFNIPKSWVRANDIIPSTLVAWKNSNGTWQILPSRLVDEDALYYYLEATTSGFSLFGVSGQKNVVAPTENQPSSSQTPVNGQQTQVIFIIALGIFIASAMLLASTFKRHK